MTKAKSRAHRFDERHSRLNEEFEFFLEFELRNASRIMMNHSDFDFSCGTDEIEPASGDRKRGLSNSENRFSRFGQDDRATAEMV